MQKKFISFLKRQKHDFYYENVFLFERESDILSVKDWVIHEYEFKVGQADFRKDIKKNRHNDNRKPHYFYYVLSSEDIINGQYLSYAGIYVRKITKDGFSRFVLIKEPEIIRDWDITDSEMYSLLKKTCNAKKND